MVTCSGVFRLPYLKNQPLYQCLPFPGCIFRFLRVFLDTLLKKSKSSQGFESPCVVRMPSCFKIFGYLRVFYPSCTFSGNLYLKNRNLYKGSGLPAKTQVSL